MLREADYLESVEEEAVFGQIGAVGGASGAVFALSLAKRVLHRVEPIEEGTSTHFHDSNVAQQGGVVDILGYEDLMVLFIAFELNLKKE